MPDVYEDLTPLLTEPVRERLFAKFDRLPESECWTWLSHRTVDGYGVMMVAGKVRRAHRLVWCAFRGPIPAGLQLDHLCRNRGCVNPEHLELVTLQENVARGNAGEPQRARTHCPRQHPYAGANLVVWADGKRRCRRCLRDARSASRSAA